MKDEDILANVKIAAPCPTSWNSMDGDDKVRFCSLCKLNVYNISGMSSSEAAALIRGTEDRLCLRLLRRRDGTVITDNCPVGLRKLRDTARRCAVAAITIACWLGFPADAWAQQGKDAAAIEGVGEAPCVRVQNKITNPINGDVYRFDDPDLDPKATEQRAQTSAWYLAIPVFLAGLLLLAKRRRQTISIVKIGIVLASIIGISGLIWGLYVAGVFPSLVLVSSL